MNHWIETHTGRAFDLHSPQPDMIDLEDIAYALSRMPRFTGHTHGSVYSVAQHSVIGARYVAERYGEDRLTRAMLLHDASEAYTCDLSAPLKRLIREYTDAFDAIEARIQGAINERFGLYRDAHKSPRVKAADKRLVVAERRDHMGPPVRGWHRDLDHIIPLPAKHPAWGWQCAADVFLKTAHTLDLK